MNPLEVSPARRTEVVPEELRLRRQQRKVMSRLEKVPWETPRKMGLVSMGMRGAAPKGMTFLSKGTEEDNSEGCVLLNTWRAD